MMAISKKKLWPQPLPRASTPIKYITENGFILIRASDLDPSANSSPSDCNFLVQRDDGPQREIHVSFGRDLINLLRVRRRTPLSDDSVFWLVCAESCLANYLWEYDELPPNNFAVNELSPDELMLAVHWRDQD